MKHGKPREIIAIPNPGNQRTSAESADEKCAEPFLDAVYLKRSQSPPQVGKHPFERNAQLQQIFALQAFGKSRSCRKASWTIEATMSASRQGTIHTRAQKRNFPEQLAGIKANFVVNIDMCSVVWCLRRRFPPGIGKPAAGSGLENQIPTLAGRQTEVCWRCHSGYSRHPGKNLPHIFQFPGIVQI